MDSGRTAHTGKGSDPAVLTPASPADLPPLGELVADDPFWRYPAWGLAREGIAHLRIWTIAADLPGHVAVVTETGLEDSVTESAGRIWADLVRRYGPECGRAWADHSGGIQLFAQDGHLGRVLQECPQGGASQVAGDDTGSGVSSGRPLDIRRTPH